MTEGRLDQIEEANKKLREEGRSQEVMEELVAEIRRCWAVLDRCAEKSCTERLPDGTPGWCASCLAREARGKK